jgi:DNA-directed RNA polymerase specialized sigma24 family protein
MSDAFVRFYEQNVLDVYGYLIYRVGARAEAERLTQLTFERAAHEWSTLRSDPDGDRLRLFRIAREAASTRRPADGDDPGLAPDLANALAKLDRSARSVIALRWGANLAGPEIATVLGVSEDTVRRRLSRGLRRLRTELDNDGARSDPAGLGAEGGEREQAPAPRPGGGSRDA